MTAADIDTAANPFKKTVAFCIKLLITGALMGVIFYKVPLSDVLQHYKAIHFGTVAWIFVWLLTAFLLSVWRWYILATTVQPATPFWLTLQGLSLERFLNQAIPTTLGGDIARAVAISKPPLAFPASFLSVIMDRIYGLMGLGMFVLFLSVFLADHITQSLTLFSIVACTGTVVGLCLLVLFLPLHWITAGMQRLANRFQQIDFYSARIQKLLDLRRLYSHQKPTLVCSCILLTVAVHLAQLRVFQILAIDVSGTALSYWDTVLFVTPAFFFSLIPVSVSGWGLREMGVIFMLALIGIPASIAAGISILFGVAYALFSVTCGLFYALCQARSVRYKKLSSPGEA